MVFAPKAVICVVLPVCLFASLSVFAISRQDAQSSKNGVFDCTAGNPCEGLDPRGTVTLTGTDRIGNSVIVTVNLFDWGTCDVSGCQPVPNSTILDVGLTGTTSQGVQSFVINGVLSSPGGGFNPYPGYVACPGSNPTVAVGCVNSPAPDGFDVQESTPIPAADGTNTRWDFPLSDPFGEILCLNSGNQQDLVCPNGASGGATNEAILYADGSVESNNLNTDSNNYLVILTDGTQLGSLKLPSLELRNAPNNTQATETVISTPSYRDYNNTAGAYPQEDPSGNQICPGNQVCPAEGFVLAPVPSCNPINDTRTFRTVWYSYKAPSDGTVAISTAKSRYDTLINVFTSTNPNVGCDDDSPPNNPYLPQSAVTFGASAGETYQIVVEETPPIQTNATGVLVGYPLSVDGTLYFNFQFTPNAATASIAPASLQFPGQPVNTTSSQQQVSLTNVGSNPLSISNVNASSGFSESNTCPATLAYNTSCNISVTFTPVYGGSVNGSLTITDNALNSPQIVNLSGTGVDFQQTASSLSSSSLAPGQSATATITITPMGGFNSPISLSCSIAPSVSSPPACSFSKNELPNGSGSSTLTVSTTASSTTQTFRNKSRGGLLNASLLPIIGVVLLGVGWTRVKGKASLLPLCLMISGLAMLTSCGGGGPSTPTGSPGTTAGNYTVTVTSTAGSNKQTSNLPFTVQ
jgi:hypothetical protein